MVRPERRVLLAGASPVRVSAGALGSRPQPGGEILWARAGRQKPLRREQRIGPQQSVNAIASSDYQPKGVWEGRDAHITAKAIDNPLEPERGWTSSGSQAAARFERRMRNRRGPTWQPTSGKDRAYKAGWLKSCGAGRESEGSIVPGKACSITRWREGTLLWSSWPGGKCEGMAARPNNPSLKHENSPTPAMDVCRAAWRSGGYAGLRATRVTVRRAPGYLSAFAGCACHVRKIIVKPCAGKPQARFERGFMETGR
jgi:hypothetical protein